MKKFLKAEEVAELIHMSKASIYRYTSERKIPFIKLGRRIVFDESAIETWLNSQTVEPGTLN